MKIELTKDEIQTIANTLYEFVETSGATITRENELEKIRAIYKKLYDTLNQKNNKKNQYKISLSIWLKEKIINQRRINGKYNGNKRRWKD